jgi:hypothetical protein
MHGSARRTDPAPPAAASPAAAKVIPLPRSRWERASPPSSAGSPVLVVLSPEQQAWAEEVVSSPTLDGLACSVADLLRLGLEELRRSRPSRVRLERAIRAQVWRQRSGDSRP